MVKAAFVGRYKVFGDEPWLVGIAVVCAFLIAFLATVHEPDRAKQEAIVSTLMAVETNTTSLQRYVVRSGSNLASNYRQLEQPVANLRDLRSTLMALVSSSDIQNEGSLSMLCERLVRSMERDYTVIDDFKNKNTRTRVALKLFNSNFDQFNENVDSQLGQTIKVLLSQFLIEPNATLSRKIRSYAINLIASGNYEASQAEAYSKYLITIIDTIPQVDNLVSSMRVSKTPEYARELQRKYLEVYGQTDSRYTWSRVLLDGILLILCGYVSILIFHLRVQTKRLTRRLAFEQAAKEIKGRFVSETLGDFSATLQEGLAILATFFNASYCELIFINVESGEIIEMFGSSAARDPSIRLAMVETALELYNDSFGSGSPDILLSYTNLQSQSDLSFTRDAMSSGSVIGMEISSRRGAALIFDYNEGRRKVHKDEVVLMEAAIELLVLCTDLHRKRQEREILERRLEHAERLQAVGILAAGIANEFNNILAAIQGYGEMATRLLRRPSRVRSYIHEITTAGKRAQYIVEQILHLSRKRGKYSKPIEVGEVVSEIAPVLLASFPEPFDLSLNLPDAKAVIIANPLEIQQILIHLCKNALEASGARKSIEIKVQLARIQRRRVLSHGELQPGHYVCLSIADQGGGIAKSDIPQIFQPFFTTRSHVGGTGLGLASVQGSTVGLSGEINVESTVGLGTCFELFFPVCDEPASLLKDFYQEPSVPLGRGQRILVLDVDQTQLIKQEEKIAALGYEPLGFSDVDRFFEWILAGQNLPELFVIDVNSFESTRNLRDMMAVVEDVPYLLVVDASWNVHTEKEQFGETEILRKPINNVDLARAIFKKFATRQIPQSHMAI